MAILQVRDIDERLYEHIKTSAKQQNRSISQEVITILEEHLNSTNREHRNATLEFLAMEGSWKDDRPAAEIAADIRAGRRNSRRFGYNDVLFD